MTNNIRLANLRTRLLAEQRASLMQAADAGVVPAAGALARIACAEGALAAVETMFDEQVAGSNQSVSTETPAPREGTTTNGTVKWFNVTKGFGFIEPDDGGPDAFVHISAVERAGMTTLQEGQKLSYEMVADKRSGKQAADRIKAVG